jgi:PAS domain S-box-containing protein
MTPTALLLSYITVLNVSIGLYVYRRNPTEPSHRAFAFMAAMIGVWTIGLIGVHYSPFGNTLALRLAFAAASLIPIGVLSFVEHTPSHCSYNRRHRSRFFFPVAVAFCIASFSPLIVISVTSDTHSSIIRYGPLHPIFASFVVASFVYSIYILLQRYHASTGLTRIHIRHLIFAFAVPCALATLTNLAAPLFLRTSNLSKYGPFFTLPLLALLGHSIIRHRLLNFRVVVRRSVVYLAAFCSAGIVLIVLLSLLNLVIHDDHGIPIREMIVCFGVAICFTPIKERIRLALDRYLYREPYDYQRTVRQASQSLRATIQLTALLDHVIRIVDSTLKPENVAVYLREEDETAFHLAKSLPGKMFPEILAMPSALITSLVNTAQIAFRDELLSVKNPARDLLALEFDRLNADVVVPLIEEADVIGILCLGQKRSGDPYFSDDADLLATLANQSSVAIRNAQTHQRVVQLNEELQTILSTIESGVVAVGAKARITLFNRTAERLIGMPAISAKGQRVEDLPPALARCLGATLADGEPRSQVEFSLPDAAGQLVPLVCSTSALVTPAGQRVGAVAAVNDISHLKELEHEKRRTDRLASIEAIAAGLVHEIRNPLVAVKTFSQLLPTKYHDPEFRETFSRTAGREIRRIDDLLTRFRTLVSASSQPIESVDVTDPIRHIVDLLRPQFDERQIRVRQVWDGAPRPILGNTPQLEQLFLNLCLNAMEAMGAGGELTLRIADLTEGGGTTLLVEVSDTGTGIPEELLAKIFDPFVSTKARGSGLGLAICRGVADAHRARLRARNNGERSGSTFTIEFPVPVVAPSPTTAT